MYEHKNIAVSLSYPIINLKSTKCKREMKFKFITLDSTLLTWMRQKYSIRFLISSFEGMSCTTHCKLQFSYLTLPKVVSMVAALLSNEISTAVEFRSIR